MILPREQKLGQEKTTEPVLIRRILAVYASTTMHARAAVDFALQEHASIQN
jgi:hypothetical protein